MNRRNFAKTAGLTAISLNAFGLTAFKSTHLKNYITLRVNEKRIVNRIAKLAKFGTDANGLSYRVAYTKGDIEARAWFIELMKNAGLNPYIDTAGNIIGKRKGKNPNLKPIAFGSHIDMVPDGGNYDGTLGSLSALEVIEILNENQYTTAHPLEVIIFANEEGGTIGSMAMVGNLKVDGLQQKSQMGLTQAEGIKVIGGNPDAISSSMRKKGDLKAFLELHIEQGGILEQENIEIGIVEGIVGIVHWEVTVEGFANHAGTTPMKLRKDALLAAAKFIEQVNEIALTIEGNHVATVGKINAMPGAYNVIPGKVILGLEIRDLSSEKIEMLFATMEKQAASIAMETKTKISFERQANESKPALADKTLQQIIEKSAKAMGFSTKYMQSGAGHDSQEIALIAPVAMIFVPSVGGISHSPKEFTKSIDIANGANVLLQTILALDKI
ncbi:MAG: N-carbamoyl-L-amino-acid hydrolase [Flavobacteriales bacterium]|jgi:N-carbamoyl-L-amino-acid hydrolase